MIENYWKLFVVSVTRLRHRLLTDLFASAQLRITILYILVGTLTFVLTGLYVDYATKSAFSELVNGPVDINGLRDFTMFTQLMQTLPALLQATGRKLSGPEALAAVGGA